MRVRERREREKESVSARVCERHCAACMRACPVQSNADKRPETMMEKGVVVG